MKQKIKKIILKKGKKKIVSLTAYSKSIGKILDNYCDIVLVGDSMANVLYGHKNTHKISLQNIIDHASSVKLGVKKALFVVDMPKGTYNSLNKSLKNAKLIVKKTRITHEINKNKRKIKNLRKIMG